MSNVTGIKTCAPTKLNGHMADLEAKRLFDQIDEDQSGELSLLELQTHLADLGFTDVDAEQLLFDLDTDKNGQVLVA